MAGDKIKIVTRVMNPIEGEEQADMALLARLHKAAFGADASWDAQIFSSLLFSPGYEAWVISVQDQTQTRPVGFLLWRDCTPFLIPREWEIITLAVDPGYQRRGLAKILLGQLTEHLGPDGHIFLEVSVKNQVARSLYADVGFKYIGLRKNYYGDNSDAELLRFSQDKQQ